MPFESGALELIFLSIVALVVVGPKDLPILLRKVGQFTAKMRGLAAEFRSSFDEMARQSELDELRKEVEALRTGQFASAALPGVEEHFSEINAHLTGASPPARLGTPPLPVLNATPADEPRFTDDLDSEPLLPFDGPSGEEAYREPDIEHDRRRSRDTVDDGSLAAFEGPAGEEAYREPGVESDRRRSRDTVDEAAGDDGAGAAFDGPAGEEDYRRHTPRAPSTARA